jgi:hypothetical protein
MLTLTKNSMILSGDGNFTIVMTFVTLFITHRLTLLIPGFRGPTREEIEVGEDWAGLSQQIIRIAADKPLELDLQMGVETDDVEDAPGESLLYTALLKIVAPVSDCPNICNHFWNCTLGRSGLKASLLGEVRTKCKR